MKKSPALRREEARHHPERLRGTMTEREVLEQEAAAARAAAITAAHPPPPLPRLFPRQRATLDLLCQAEEPPTVRELAQALGVTPRAAWQHLVALERKGFLRRLYPKDVRRSRAFRVVRGAAPDGAGEAQ